MPPKRRLRKIIDYEAVVSCASGPGLIREEVWEDGSGNIVRHNLAFINHFLTAQDNGRVLGYDNAHGLHHRHYCGSVEPASAVGYEMLARSFYDEVEQLRKRTR